LLKEISLRLGFESSHDIYRFASRIEYALKATNGKIQTRDHGVGSKRPSICATTSPRLEAGIETG